MLILLLLNQKIRKNRIKKFHDSKIMKNSNHTNFEKPIKKRKMELEYSINEII